MKTKKINNKGIKSIIRKSISNNSTLSEDKIDSIIKEYLMERSEFQDIDDSMGPKSGFSPKSTEAVESMIDGLLEMVDDMDIIKEKESDVMINDNQYADEYLNIVIEDLRTVIEDLEHLNDLTKSGYDDTDEVNPTM